MCYPLALTPAVCTLKISTTPPTVYQQGDLMKYRRFGKTEIQIPVISSGGMRFQESWKGSDPVSQDSQDNLEACVHKAMDLGINHFETARGYGTSEQQLGRILPKLPRQDILVQTKVAPSSDVNNFTTEFEKSMGLLNLDYIDIFSFHGINTPQLLEDSLKCMEIAQSWKKEGRIRSIGFSTHGPTEILLKSIATEAFDHINLHWYYIFQNNWPAIQAANALDMGVFIISPNHKGGMLNDPSDKLRQLTAPLHPMVFNGLFCLARPEVSTLSCGVATPEDFDLHMETINKLNQAKEHIAPILKRLEEAMVEALGEKWANTWEEGLPDPAETPGELNIPWILRLRNLALAFDMIEYGKMRYNLLGKANHWFAGNKADKTNGLDLSECLKNSPNAAEIPSLLRDADRLLQGPEQERLQKD